MSNNQSIFYKTLKAWLPLAAIIVIFSGLVYATIQQNYRQNANDPQIQIAEDLAAEIQQGRPANTIVPATGTTDISQSLSLFVMIYDDSKKLIGSSALLDGKNPDYPQGVLDNVRKVGEERVTWQPRDNVRMATVVKRYSGQESGFVVTGRSLREVEKRVARLTLMVALAAGFALVVTFLLVWLFKLMEFMHTGHDEHVELVFDSEKK